VNCEYVKNELAIHFGRDELPPDVLSHLEGCQECRKNWDELRDMAGAMPTNEAFALEPWELEEAVAIVDRAVARRPLPMAIRFQEATKRWLRAVTDMRPVPAVAAVALVLIISLGTMRFELSAPDTDMVLEVLSTSEVSLATTEDDIEDPDDAIVEVLLSEFTQPWHGGSAEWLLDDITDDEYEYLLQSMDVGDLL